MNKITKVGNHLNLEHGIKVILLELKNIPKKPGIYKMINSSDEPIYIGKAKNLYKRVLSYTKANKLNRRLITMISNIQKIEINITNSEVEALLLESNLIKKFEPKFNVLLKDDKSFSSIYISTNDDFPKMITHRGMKNKKGKYFGPFTSKSSINKTIETLQKVFLIRNCSDNIFNTRSRPCLQYQIKRCSAPCVNYISKVEYLEGIQNVINFLSGKSQNIKKILSDKMYEKSENQNYEEAAILRNQIYAISNVITSQNINYQNLKNLDLIYMIKKQNYCVVQMSIIRNGSNYGSISHFPKITDYGDDLKENEIMSAFLNQYYKNNDAPKLIIVNVTPEQKSLLEELFSKQQKHLVKIYKPLKGFKLKILNDLEKTALQNLNKKLFQNTSNKKNLFNLSKLLNINEIKKIETYDNSHNQGTNAIGAFITFTENGFEKNLYRKFIIKGLIQEKTFKFNDDYSMMEEVITRRFKNNTTIQPPDLVLIDGGKGHLRKVQDTLNQIKNHKIFVLAVSKGRDRNSGNENFYYGDNKELFLNKNDPIRFFLQNLRDEAHRFAIGYHRSKRTKALFKNPVDEIQGIGKIRKRNLLNYFGSSNGIKKASIEDLEKVPNINKKTAEIIFNFFNGS